MYLSDIEVAVFIKRWLKSVVLRAECGIDCVELAVVGCVLAETHRVASRPSESTVLWREAATLAAAVLMYLGDRELAVAFKKRLKGVVREEVGIDCVELAVCDCVRCRAVTLSVTLLPASVRLRSKVAAALVVWMYLGDVEVTVQVIKPRLKSVPVVDSVIDCVELADCGCVRG